MVALLESVLAVSVTVVRATSRARRRASRRSAWTAWADEVRGAAAERESACGVVGAWASVRGKLATVGRREFMTAKLSTSRAASWRKAVDKAA